MRTLIGFMLFCSASVLAQVGYTEAIVACENAAAELANVAAENRNEALAEKRAAVIREKAGDLTRKFVDASTSLRAEKDRLMTDAKANAAPLKKVNEAEARLEKARERLKFLMKSLADDKTALAALKSGFMERTAEEVAASTRGVGEALKASDAALGTADVGEVELRSLKVSQGKVKLFVVNAGESTELTPEHRVHISVLPVVIRAEIQDQNRTRLKEQREKHLLPAGTEFVDTEGKCRDGREFAYQNPSVGKTTWTVSEKFTWEPRGETKDRLRGLAMRNSDPCAENDRLELHVKDGATQRMEFSLHGKATWKRVSKSKAGAAREETVEPQDGTVDAELVLSTWPK